MKLGFKVTTSLSLACAVGFYWGSLIMAIFIMGLGCVLISNLFLLFIIPILLSSIPAAVVFTDLEMLKEERDKVEHGSKSF